MFLENQRSDFGAADPGAARIKSRINTVVPAAVICPTPRRLSSLVRGYRSFAPVESWVFAPRLRRQK